MTGQQPLDTGLVLVGQNVKYGFYDQKGLQLKPAEREMRALDVRTCQCNLHFHFHFHTKKRMKEKENSNPIFYSIEYE